MHKMKIGLCLASLLLVVQSTVFSAIVPMDSTAFSDKYEGDTDTVANASNVWASGTSHSSDGNVLTYTLPTGPMGGGTWIEPANWASTVSNDYTIETRLKLNATTNPSHLGAFNIYAVTQTNGGGVYLFVGESCYTYFKDGAWVTVPTASNTDGFHTFRLAHEGGTSTVSLWRDGVQTDLAGAAWAGSTMSWLGGTGATAGSGDVDYFRWTAGAYSPVPEPMTLALLTLGGLILRKRS